MDFVCFQLWEKSWEKWSVNFPVGLCSFSLLSHIIHPQTAVTQLKNTCTPLLQQSTSVWQRKEMSDSKIFFYMLILELMNFLPSSDWTSLPFSFLFLDRYTKVGTSDWHNDAWYTSTLSAITVICFGGNLLGWLSACVEVKKTIEINWTKKWIRHIESHVSIRFALRSVSHCSRESFKRSWNASRRPSTADKRVTNEHFSRGTRGRAHWGERGRGRGRGAEKGRWRNRDESVSTADCSESEDFISYFSLALMGREAQRERLRQQSDEWSAALRLSLSAVYLYCRGAADWGEEEEAEYKERSVRNSVRNTGGWGGRTPPINQWDPWKH